MGRGNSIIVLFILLLISIIPSNLYSYKINAISNNHEYLFIEERTLKIKFIGLSRENVSYRYLEEYLNQTIPSEYPFGDKLSNLILIPSLEFINEDVRDQFSDEIYLRSILVNDSAYYIRWGDFYSVIERIFAERELNQNTITALVINFLYQNSPFGIYPVYINYTRVDLDTKKKSEFIAFAENGVCFEVANSPILGIITSTLPVFEVERYPFIQDLKDCLISKYSWTQNLAQTIEQAVWSRLNPSPIFRYNIYQHVRIHLSLINLDLQHDVYELLNMLNVSLIRIKIAKLLGGSEVSLTSVVTHAPEDLKVMANQNLSSYFRWSNSIAYYFQQNGEKFWDQPYHVKQGRYNDHLDIYAAILVGSELFLPWSNNYGGLTHYSSNTSEYGGLVVVTMNYKSIFSKNEGLTRTTLHELGHIFGLVHPHDYWNVQKRMVEYSWIWGYTPSPMTYLVSGYDWNFFDVQLVGRIQLAAVLRSMGDSHMEDKKISQVYQRLREGSFGSYQEILAETITIFEDYLAKEQWQEFYRSIVVFSCIIAIMGLSGLFYYYFRRNRF